MAKKTPKKTRAKANTTSKKTTAGTKKSQAGKTTVPPKSGATKKTISPSKSGAGKSGSVSPGTPPAQKTTMPASANALPSGVRYFAEKQTPTVDGQSTIDGKWLDGSDAAYYNSDYYKSHQKAVQPFNPSRSPVFMDLSTVLQSTDISKIKATNQIKFHAVGDTGVTAIKKLTNEDAVSTMMVHDMAQNDPPSFFFHLGDVIYSFGEEAYYYEQFYDPFRNYDAPIFAIPGNHDGMIYDANMESLEAFYANFCTPQPQVAPNAGGLIRTTMNQPGVYFTLDAPFVSIIGLYSNVIDGGPGVISTQGGKFATVTDVQLTFLASELARLKTKRLSDPRAIIVTVHHPPFSGDAQNGGSPRMSQDLDNAFKAAGLWPDAVLSGHAHHYERFNRVVGTKNIPYIIAGSGGYNMLPMPGAPTKFPYVIPKRNDLTLQNYLGDYGYLEVIVQAGSTRTLTINFNSTNATLPNKGIAADSVVVPW